MVIMPMMWSKSVRPGRAGQPNVRIGRDAYLDWGRNRGIILVVVVKMTCFFCPSLPWALEEKKLGEDGWPQHLLTILDRRE